MAQLAVGDSNESASQQCQTQVHQILGGEAFDREEITPRHAKQVRDPCVSDLLELVDDFR